MTVERASALVPFERMVVVASSPYEALAREHLAQYPGIHLLTQPSNLDTGPGILLPLAAILQKDPAARVVLLPSDHHVPRPQPFLEAIRTANAASLSDPSRVTLIGAASDSPETDYGWIVPGRLVDPAGGTPVRAVERFVEKPAGELARRLHRAGGLWNTFASAGSAAAYWSHAQRHLPGHAALFESCGAAAGPAVMDALLLRIYSRMPPANFSREVLERAAGLAVVTVAGSGWSDWGSPERVYASLERGSDLPALRRRLLDRGDFARPGGRRDGFASERRSRRERSVRREERDQGGLLERLC
jgi:mannose-1-phosphate guanylyltransferase